MTPDEYKVDSWQLNDESKLKSSETLRLEGNILFKDGKFDEAKDKYREALTLLDTLLLKEKPGDPEYVELDSKVRLQAKPKNWLDTQCFQNIPLYLNLSQCYLNLQNFYEAFGAAEEVLKRDSENEKGLFRKAKAQIGTWNLDEAEKILMEVKQKYPGSAKAVEAQLNILNEKRKEKNASDKTMYKAMLSNHHSKD